MQPVVDEIKRLVLVVLQHPDTHEVQTVVAVAALLMLVLLVTKVGNLFNFPLSSSGRSVVLIAVNGVLIAAAAAVVDVYVGPKIPSAAMVTWLPLVTAIAVLLVVTAPMMMLIQKARYVSAVICLVLSIGGGVATVTLTRSVLQAFSQSNTQFEKSRDSKKSELNDVMVH